MLVSFHYIGHLTVAECEVSFEVDELEVSVQEGYNRKRTTTL